MQKNRGHAMALIFGAIGLGIAYLFVGKIGWQTALGVGIGMTLGRALAGEYDPPQSTNNLQSDLSTNSTQYLQSENSIPGSQTGLSKKDEAILFNDQGVLLDLQGNRDAAMELWTKAALAGVANALASFSWTALKAERFEDAITLHEECFPKLNVGIDAYQMANCKSNYALNLLAYSGDIQRSKNIWLSNKNSNHAESKFFAILAASVQGNLDESMELAKVMTASDWEEVRSTLFEEKLSNKGWFKDWCSKGLDLINDIRK